ncbi:DNA cross-link repair 1A protein [Mizuhopecten yessoensis]|uniref:DNA cross-link repair 1A protein n=1 Tax=Mizuhopecten yessoensis TaxID=6573 RepID=A0A210QD33_MIZYE|nr:DNA cross-link repair 1A protein [Mizuhopecten yessoensis]
MKRSVPILLKENDSEDDEIWDYKCLKREKRDPKSQSRVSGRTANGLLSSANKRLNKKTREKKMTDSQKQLNENIKKEGSKNKHAAKLSQKNEKTPSKPCRPDLLEGFCPHCQVPYTALSFKSPTWHVNECLDKDMSNIECPAGILCDNTIPSHYWKFSHRTLAQLRGSGQKTDTSSILSHQKDEQYTSQVKINLFDDDQPGHSRNLNNKKKTCDVNTINSDDELCKKKETVTAVSNNQEISDDISVSNEDISESQEEIEKDLDEMLADAFDVDSTDSTYLISSSVSKLKDEKKMSNENSTLVIIKETFGIQLDEGVSYSPLSSPRGKSPSSTKSFSQGSLDNFMKSDWERNPSTTLSAQELLPFKTPTKSGSSSARKSSNKKSASSTKKTSDLESPRMTSSSKKARKSTSKKKSGNDLLETGESTVGKSPGPDQPSVKSFFKCLNAKKVLFEKSGENTSAAKEVSPCLLQNNSCVQVTSVNNMKESDLDNNGSVCEGVTPLVVIQKDSDNGFQDTSSGSNQNRSMRSETRYDKDSVDLSRVKEETSGSSTLRQKHVAKENTDKSPTNSSKSKNAFSVLMDKTKSQSTNLRHSTTSQSQSVPGKVDAMAILMKAKQSGPNRNDKTSVPVQSTSTGANTGESDNLNIPEPEKKQWGGQRQCPFYKKMPGTGITVDAFSFGTIPDCSAYFLSHFHYDHYRGLTKKFKHPIYCSKITANLVERRIKVDRQYLHTLPMATPTVVEGVEVTLLEANHCPGSVLFLFKLKGGRNYLHTGDFRACTEMESYPALTGIHVHQLYLDTTYCDPSHTFPPQQEVIDFAVSTVNKKLKENTKTLIICGSYTIGKERIFMAIAKALNSKICVTREKKAVLDCLEDSTLQESITLSPNEAKVHVLPMAKLNQKALADYLVTLKRYTEVLAFEPTGWTHSNKITSLDQLRPKFSRNGIHIYGVPYSEHSSYLEMKRFTQHLKPDKILPTVNNGNSRARSKMEGLFNSWMEELQTTNRSQNLNGAKQGTLSSWSS